MKNSGSYIEADSQRSRDIVESAETMMQEIFGILRHYGISYCYENGIPYNESPILDLPSPDQDEKEAYSFMSAYSIWCCGAYCSENKVLDNTSMDAFLRDIWKEYFKYHSQVNLSSCFAIIRKNENDKIAQANDLLIKVLTRVGFLNKRINFGQMRSLADYLLPLIELYAGYISIFIERAFRPERTVESISRVLEYEQQLMKIYPFFDSHAFILNAQAGIN